MASVKKNELAALGLLSLKPMHGYALSCSMRRLGLEHWTTLSRSSIYGALRRLWRQGAVVVTREREGTAPERLVYHIAPEGRERLRQLLREALAYVGPDDRYFYLGLAFADALACEEVIERLEQRIRLLRALVEAERLECEVLERGPAARRCAVVARAGVRHREIEIDVCEELVRILADHEAGATHGA